MIKRVYETHINVTDLDRSMAFYESLPDFELGYLDKERRIAFFFIGGWNNSMLGVWEKPAEQVWAQHLAFEIERAELADAMAALRERGIVMLDFLQQPSEEPTVFAWMPAVGIYFKDPDGHLLELIARLPGRPQPERGLITLAAWEATQ